jgi:hypothetical protein
MMFLANDDFGNRNRHLHSLKHLRRYVLCCAGGLLLLSSPASRWIASAKEKPSYIVSKREAGSFPLCVSGEASPLCVSSKDYAGVVRAGRDLQEDIHRVTGSNPLLLADTLPQSRTIVLIGTLGKNELIERLVKEKKIDVKVIRDKWEAFLIQSVDRPFPGVDHALIIVGSNKRGTIYGVYDLSASIGVSPWYWWADVPVKKQSSLFVLPGTRRYSEPKVKYRGIFINDEAPALSGWAQEKFGTDMFNHKLYEHVFELILRLKGNYLWPAMWGRAFYDDDSLNPKLADEYGVVIGTSHHEPLMRAHDEWRRYGSGKWNYEKNDSTLREFWRQGIKRMDSYESIVTVGMRGDGDEPMTESANVALLQRIVKDQRQILAEVTGKDVTTIPQDWALYKEVQEYYDKGMRVPEDITLLLCDDNWGNIRKIPHLNEAPRQGGYGIYYHFDYVGDPRNYKWLNTNQISRVWEQMHLAYEYNARQIWIVNVGDIKPMEFPISFFLDYAWDPDAWPADRLPEYTRQWAQQQFGKQYARDIADILTTYTRFNSRRKPELLSPETYSLVNYREAETVVAEYNALYEKARRISDALPSEFKDAFYQLVLHPVEACSNLNELYVTVSKNRLYAQQNRAATNSLAQKARELFARDSAITDYYNNVLAGGKWSHMMDQTHIGYTYWQQPEKNSIPEVKEIEVPDAAAMGVAIEGSAESWPNDSVTAVLPEFDPYNRQSYYIEIFNRGKTPFNYTVQSGTPWLHVSSQKGKIERGERLWVSVDWKKVPSGEQRVPVTISGTGRSVVVQAVINNPLSLKRNEVGGFVASNGYVSMEGEHYTRAVGSSSITWQKIPDLGRTLSAITPVPVTFPTQTPGGNGPHLEYEVFMLSKGAVTVEAYLSPTLNFHNTEGLWYAVSFDDEKPQLVNMHADKSNKMWEQRVANNINVQESKHKISKLGKHVLKFWMVDPGVVLQKLVVDTGGMKSSYLGPPESVHHVNN